MYSIYEKLTAASVLGREKLRPPESAVPRYIPKKLLVKCDAGKFARYPA